MIGDDDDDDDEGGRRKRLREEDDDGALSNSSVEAADNEDEEAAFDGLKLEYSEAVAALEVARKTLMVEVERRRRKGLCVDSDYTELRDHLPSMNALVAAPSSSSSSSSESVAPVVAIGYSSGSTDGEKTIVYSELSLDKATSRDEILDFCGLLGRQMRDSVMPGRLSDQRIKELPVDVPALTHYALARAADEPLYRLLFALATGVADPLSPGDGPSFASGRWSPQFSEEHRRVLGVQAAMDILNTLFLKSLQVQPTQLLVGRLLQDGGLLHFLRDTISSLCLASSRATILERRKFEFESGGDPLLSVDELRSLIITFLDNIGFRCRKTYEQFVLIFFLVLTPEKLKELNIGQTLQSWKARSLAKELPEATSSLAADADFHCLGERVAQRLASLLEVADSLLGPGATQNTGAPRRMNLPVDAPRRARALYLEVEVFHGGDDEAVAAMALDDASYEKRWEEGRLEARFQQQDEEAGFPTFPEQDEEAGFPTFPAGFPPLPAAAAAGAPYQEEETAGVVEDQDEEMEEEEGIVEEEEEEAVVSEEVRAELLYLESDYYCPEPGGGGGEEEDVDVDDDDEEEDDDDEDDKEEDDDDENGGGDGSGDVIVGASKLSSLLADVENNPTEFKRRRGAMYENQEGSMIMDMPMHRDLNQVKVVRRCAMRALEAAGYYKDGQPVPGKHNLGLPAIMVSDGSPHDAAEKLKRENPTVMKDLLCADGPFHLEKETYEATAKIMERAFLRYAVSRYMDRSGSKAQDWILHPGDPRQARQAFLFFMQGLLVGAIKSARIKLKKQEVSAGEVHAFMMARAATQPTVMLIVLWMRFLELSTMLLDTRRIGENGDHELYRRARSMSQLLFAASNCHKYVHINACSIEEWARGCDAVRDVLSKVIFTKQSAKGDTLAHSDEFVEKVIRDARAILGKHYSHGRADHIIRSIMKIPEIIGSLRQQQRASGRPNTAPDGSPRHVILGDAGSKEFQGGIKMAEDHNLWGEGTVRVKSGASFRAALPGAFVALETGLELNPALLNILSISTHRLTDYYKARRAPAEVKGMTTRFSTVPAIQSDVQDRVEWEESRRTELRVYKLNSTFQGAMGKGDQFMTLKMIREELQEWADVRSSTPAAVVPYLPEIESSIILARKKKEPLLHILAAVRSDMLTRRGFSPRSAVPEPTTKVSTIVFNRAGGEFTVDGLSPTDHPMLSLPRLGETDAAARQAPSPATPAATPAAPAPAQQDDDDDDYHLETPPPPPPTPTQAADKGSLFPAANHGSWGTGKRE